MKPAFALDFRESSVSLLHRSLGGWHLVGDVALDAPDLGEALGYLRASALGLSPRGISTKLVIPADQILYLNLRISGPDAASRRAQIRAALDGRTPYHVDDLVFDWWGNGAEVQVAVVARETLAEAEAFAAEHRFNPVSFVAIPRNGGFSGEPWFGQTAHAAKLLADGEKVDRDQDPINIIARTFGAEPEPSLATAEETPVADVDRLDAAPAAVDRLDAAPAAVDRLDAAPAAVDRLDAAPAATAPLSAETIAPQADAARSAVAPETMPKPAPEPVLQDAVLPDLVLPDPVLPDPVLPDPMVPEPVLERTDFPEASEAPMALDVPDDGPEPMVMSKADVVPKTETPDKSAPRATRITQDLPPPPPGAAISAFSSRRSAGVIPPASDIPATAPEPMAAQALVTEPEAALTQASETAQTPPPPAGPSVPPRPLVGVAAPRPALASAKPSSAGKALRGLGALVTAPGIAGSKKPRPSAPALDTRVNIKPNATNLRQPAAASRPGNAGLGNRNVAQRGKPKYLGLILTGILLLLLALIAAWSSFSLASWQGASPAIEIAAAPDTAAEVAGVEVAGVEVTGAEVAGAENVLAADIPAPDDEMLADLQDPADFLPPAEETEVPEAAVVEPPAVPVAEPSPKPEIASGTELVASPGTTPQDEIFLATADLPPAPQDPLMLPQPDARGDPLPPSQLAPPPFGTIYQFDADGLIRPTPEGIITPEGVLLIAGRPPLVPPLRPMALAPAALPAPETLPLSAAVISEVGADPALADARPKARPAALVPPVPSPDDGAALAPLVDARVASLKPRARPKTVLTAGEQARQASAAASLTAQADAAAVAASAGTAQAVLISRIPAPRPRDLSRAVEAAVAAAVRQPKPQVAPEPEPEPASASKPAPEPETQSAKAASNANPQPEDDDEPEVVTAMPKLPTRASVAKKATFVNAINLSKINLIGVYGTKNSRYALIRHANGRYKKVKVGDNLDGGKVAAITSSEVRYQKGSKLHTLAMPKG